VTVSEDPSAAYRPAADEDSDGTADPGVTRALSEEERSERESDLRALIDLMRPAVQADGGDLELVGFDVETGEVAVELRGACSSCAISSATLQGGVERILKGRLDWVSEVRGGVDETADLTVSTSLGRGGYVPKF
jgi:Fe-S cluster biogenesis protein NfuA